MKKFWFDVTVVKVAGNKVNIMRRCHIHLGPLVHFALQFYM